MLLCATKLNIAITIAPVSRWWICFGSFLCRWAVAYRLGPVIQIGVITEIDLRYVFQDDGPWIERNVGDRILTGKIFTAFKLFIKDGAVLSEPVFITLKNSVWNFPRVIHHIMMQLNHGGAHIGDFEHQPLDNVGPHAET